MKQINTQKNSYTGPYRQSKKKKKREKEIVIPAGVTSHDDSSHDPVPNSNSFQNYPLDGTTRSGASRVLVSLILPYTKEKKYCAPRETPPQMTARGEKKNLYGSRLAVWPVKYLTRVKQNKIITPVTPTKEIINSRHRQN